MDTEEHLNAGRADVLLLWIANPFLCFLGAHADGNGEEPAGASLSNAARSDSHNSDRIIGRTSFGPAHPNSIARTFITCVLESNLKRLYWRTFYNNSKS